MESDFRNSVDNYYYDLRAAAYLIVLATIDKTVEIHAIFLENVKYGFFFIYFLAVIVSS